MFKRKIYINILLLFIIFVFLSLENSTNKIFIDKNIVAFQIMIYHFYNDDIKNNDYVKIFKQFDDENKEKLSKIFKDFNIKLTKTDNFYFYYTLLEYIFNNNNINNFYIDLFLPDENKFQKSHSKFANSYKNYTMILNKIIKISDFKSLLNKIYKISKKYFYKYNNDNTINYLKNISFYFLDFYSDSTFYNDFIYKNGALLINFNKYINKNILTNNVIRTYNNFSFIKNKYYKNFKQELLNKYQSKLDKFLTKIFDIEANNNPKREIFIVYKENFSLNNRKIEELFFDTFNLLLSISIENRKEQISKCRYYYIFFNELNLFKNFDEKIFSDLLKILNTKNNNLSKKVYINLFENYLNYFYSKT